MVESDDCDKSNEQKRQDEKGIHSNQHVYILKRRKLLYDSSFYDCNTQSKDILLLLHQNNNREIEIFIRSMD